MSALTASLEIATRLREAIKTSPAGVIRFDELARHRWISAYEGLNEDHPGLYGSLIARSAAQVIRVH